MTEEEKAARQEMRRIQCEHGPRIEPWMSVYIGQTWNSALEKDPSGGQLKYVIQELKELLGIK